MRAVNLIAAQISSDDIGEVSMGNISSKLFTIVTGLWEIVSEALCHFPGQCCMVKQYLKLLSLSQNRPGSGILLRS